MTQVRCKISFFTADRRHKAHEVFYIIFYIILFYSEFKFVVYEKLPIGFCRGERRIYLQYLSGMVRLGCQWAQVFTGDEDERGPNDETEFRRLCPSLRLDRSRRVCDASQARRCVFEVK
jgi:hypothetical protein